MNTPEDPKRPELEIRSDEDWKSRVKAEDEALDEKLRQESAQTSQPEGQPQSGDSPSGEEQKRSAAGAAEEARRPVQLPPAEFGTLVSMFSTQAMVGLGALPNPATGKAEPQPELARHFIDLLSVLEDKTKGNLDQREEDLLETTLHELRLAYVETTKSA